MHRRKKKNRKKTQGWQVVDTCNLSNLEVEPGGSLEIGNQPGIHNDLQAIPGYRVRPLW